MNRAPLAIACLALVAMLPACAHEFGPHTEREQLLIAQHGEPDFIVEHRRYGLFEFDLLGIAYRGWYHDSWDDYTDAWSARDRDVKISESHWFYRDGDMLVLPRHGVTKHTTWTDDDLADARAIRRGPERLVTFIYVSVAPFMASYWITHEFENPIVFAMTEPIEHAYRPAMLREGKLP